MAYANLNRLLSLRAEGIEPRGRRSATGPQERSRPTGWTFKSGNVTIQELEFSNGYVVGALQVEGQKAIIKGPEATMRLLEAVQKNHVQECYDAWLSHVNRGLGRVAESDVVHAEQKGREGHTIGAVHGETEAVKETGPSENGGRPEAEERIERLEEDVTSIKGALDEIVGLLKQPKQG